MPVQNPLPRITLMLRLDHQAEEAVAFYTSIFKNSEKARRAMVAVLKMKKPDVAEIRRAAA